MINRSSGLLLNISSLPSDFGIGGFGWEFKETCDFLVKCGFHCWQTLPITSIGEGNSPYSSQSAFALNFLYINPYALRDKGWISETDAQNSRIYDGGYFVNYPEVYQRKLEVLTRAYANVKNDIIADLKVFEITKRWVSDYAMFKTIAQLENGKVWWKWDEKYRDITKIDRANFVSENFDKYYYFVFEQFVCDEQWSW
ncbi:MAG: 4-alpha-glucanotransferase, partial [Clostridia bacterium]